MKANNGYNRNKVTESDSGRGIHNQQKQYQKNNSLKTDHTEVDPSGVKTKPYPNQDHAGFQMGTQPMYEDSFEKALIMAEKLERESHRRNYILGIQGRDGGKKPYECHNINN